MKSSFLLTTLTTSPGGGGLVVKPTTTTPTATSTRSGNTAIDGVTISIDGAPSSPSSPQQPLSANTKNLFLLHYVMEYMPLLVCTRTLAQLSKDIRSQTITSPLWGRWCAETYQPMMKGHTHKNNSSISVSPSGCTMPYYTYLNFRKTLRGPVTPTQGGRSGLAERRPPRVMTTSQLPSNVEETGGIVSPVSMVMARHQPQHTSTNNNPNFDESTLPDGDKYRLSPTYSPTHRGSVAFLTGLSAGARLRRQVAQDVFLTLFLLSVVARAVVLTLIEGHGFPADVTVVSLFLWGTLGAHSLMVSTGNSIVPGSPLHTNVYEQGRYLYVHFAFTWLTLLLILIRYTFRCCIPIDHIPYCVIPLGVNLLSCVCVLLLKWYWVIVKSATCKEEDHHSPNCQQPKVMSSEDFASPRGVLDTAPPSASSSSLVTSLPNPSVQTTRVCIRMVPAYLSILLCILFTTPTTSWYAFLAVVPMGILSCVLFLVACQRAGTTPTPPLQRYFTPAAALLTTTIMLSVIAVAATLSSSSSSSPVPPTPTMNVNATTTTTPTTSGDHDSSSSSSTILTGTGQTTLHALSGVVGFILLVSYGWRRLMRKESMMSK